MKKKVISVMLIACCILSMVACGEKKDGDVQNQTSKVVVEQPSEESSVTKLDYEVVAPVENVEDGQVLLSVEDAIYTEGEGIGPTEETMATAYDKDWGMILGLAPKSEITYTVPNGTEGSYDIYLRVSKNLAGFGSTPFTFSINGAEAFAVPMDIQVPANAPNSSKVEDASFYTGTMCDTGRFLVKQTVDLKAGDTIRVIAAHGSRSGELGGIVFPNVGSILLAPAGSEVATGYDNTIKAVETADDADPLSGLNIIWVGSSVTYGAQATGFYSLADAIADAHPATTCEKYAVSATTLVNDGRDSYVSRLKEVPKDKKPDLVVVQLSTNDATTGKPYGELTDSKDPSSFDDKTIIGAIESIITYTDETFGCPVVFYTGTYYESEEYATMVDCLHQVQDKWGIGVIDMFNNEEMTAVYGTSLYNEYMSDEIHPFRKGYVEWWTPVIERSLEEFLTK